MTIQEKILLDKWLEANYHLKRMKEKWFENQNEGVDKSKESREFKYEFNSFVNSSRSLTFVMQKCFKNKAEGFETWYENIQEELKRNEFAKLLVDLRNINQKEGNKYPDIIEVRVINDYFLFETTYSPFPSENNDLIDKMNLSEEQKKQISQNIVNFNIIPRIENFDINLTYDNKPEETFDDIREKMEEILFTETFKQIATRILQITDDEFKNASKAPSKLKIKEKIYSWETFYEECTKLLVFYKQSCIECVKLFT